MKDGEELRIPTPAPAGEWTEQARRRWKDAIWVHGNGPLAVLAHCRSLTITLWPTIEDANDAKAFIDNLACGGACERDHEIVELEEEGSRNG